MARAVAVPLAAAGLAVSGTASMVATTAATADQISRMVVRIFFGARSCPVPLGGRWSG
ncbi:hypothetical protein GCM10023196_052960 [Actinoallomurus vinaceus]|uniref:Uncharacterized protein n=1 Tax=Actinoallomurus vinaceus TaxID=1080074 RepID=A0ABP8UE57_9ACTN